MQQAEQGCRFRRQQALQPHQHAPHGAQVFALGHQAPGQQVVFDIVDPRHGVAHDVDQHVGLVAQQMDQQFHRRADRLVVLDDGLAQALDRLQRRAARRDDEVLRHACPHGGNVGRFERKIVHHIVDHGDQGVFRLFDARGTGTLVQGFIEFVGQPRVRHQPFFAGRMRQIEMQPDEFLCRPRRTIGQPGQRRRRVERQRLPFAAKQEAPDQARGVRAVGKTGSFHRHRESFSRSVIDRRAMLIHRYVRKMTRPPRWVALVGTTAGYQLRFGLSGRRSSRFGTPSPSRSRRLPLSWS